MKITLRICAFALLIGVVLSLCGCAALNFRYEYDKGMRFYNEKKYDEAIVSFNNALNYKPDSYSALCLLGTSYLYKKDYKMAEKTFHDATKLFPDRWNAYVFLGDLKRNQRDYQSAIDYYETAVTLESMGGKEKTYYKKYLKNLRDEHADYKMKLNNEKRQMQLDKESLASDVYKKREISLVPVRPTGFVVLNLDKSKWEKVLEQIDEKSKLFEYGLKGEDVKNFKWSQLVTVQYFVISQNFPTTLDTYFNGHISKIESIAKNSGKTFEKKIILQHKNEILYEWSFDNAKETELARIIYSPKCIYHIHFAKKGDFTTDEKKLYIELLKNAILE